MIFASLKPASSSIRRAFSINMQCHRESNLIPIKLMESPNSFATLIAVGTPDFKVWNVSTKTHNFYVVLHKS